MKVILGLLSAVMVTPQAQAQAQAQAQPAQAQDSQAKAFYKELYAAGGLDKTTAEYLCFRDDSENVFFTFADSSVYQHFLEANRPLKPSERRAFKSPWIALTEYRNGVAWGDRMYFDQGANGFFSAETKVNGYLFKLRYTFNRETLRYIYEVTPLAVPPQSQLGTGKCEIIPVR